MSASSDYVESVHAAFDEAAAAAGGEDRSYRLAGHVLRLRFAGAAIGPLLAPAFEHLETDPGTPASMTISAWDRQATGVAAPAPPWGIEDYAPRERIRGVDPGMLRASYDIGHGLLSLAEPRSGRGVFHARDADLIPRWVVRMPFRPLLGGWAGECGLALIHAAAVGKDGACVLLPGSSGSGKSTTALAASEHGLDFLADDLCLVHISERRAYAPFGWAKVEAEALQRLPTLTDKIRSTEEGQSLLRPANLVREAGIVAIAIPRTSGGHSTTWQPASARQAVFALAPSTLIEGNGAGPSSLAALTGLARAVPAFDLELGTDMAGVAQALSDLVDSCRT